MNSRAITVLSVFFLVMTAWVVGAANLAEVCDTVCVKIRQITNESPFVVAIYAYRAANPELKFPGGMGTGTGIVTRLEGGTVGILTNNHVIDKPLASRVWVAFHKQGFMHEATIMGRDPAADLALLSIPTFPAGMRSAVFAKRLELGQQVYALGYPFGIRRTNFGYVNTRESHSWLYAETQTPVSPGNSGGPLFNEKHEVVGINTAMIPGATTTFVLPIEYVHRIMPRLMREEVVRHASAGFRFYDASRIPPLFFETRGLKYPPEEDWVIVYEMELNSPASRVDIKKGDIIRKFNGMMVKSAQDLDMKIFFDHRPEESAVFTMQRGVQKFERGVVLTEYMSVFEDREKEKSH